MKKYVYVVVEHECYPEDGYMSEVLCMYDNPADAFEYINGCFSSRFNWYRVEVRELEE